MFVNDLFKLKENSNEEYYAVVDQRGKPMIMRKPVGKTAEAYAEEKNYRIKGGPFSSHQETESFWIRSVLPNKKQDVDEAHGPLGKLKPSDIEKIKKAKEREKKTAPGQLRRALPPSKQHYRDSSIEYFAKLDEQDIDPEQDSKRSSYPPKKDFPNWYDMRDRAFEVHRDDGSKYFVEPGTEKWNDIYDRQFPDHPRPDNLRDVYSDGNPVAEAGPFSYGAKKPKKGSVADLAAKKRQEQEKGKQPVEPRDQRVGTARVKKDVAEGEHPETWHDVDPSLGKQVNKMSQAEKVSKGFAHSDTLKKKTSFIQKLDAKLQQLGYTITQEGNVYRWTSPTRQFVEVEPDTEDPGWYGWAEGQVTRSGKLNYGSSGNDSAKDIVAIFKSGGVFRKQGVAEGISVVDQDYDLDQMILTLDIEGKKVSFTYWDYDENFANAERRDVFDQLQKQPWYAKLDHPTRMEILDAAYRAIRGLEPQEYRPTVRDEPLDEQGVAEGLLGNRTFNRVMPVVERIASEVSDYDRDEFGEELWSLLDQKYGSKFAQSVLQDDLDFYWNEYTELAGKDIVEGSAQEKLYKRHQELRKKSGLPDPDYYKELKATYDLPDEERYKKAAELKKKYKVTNEDITQYLEEMQRAGYDIVTESATMCPECGGAAYADRMLAEKQDACYHKVKSRYKVWPSAYASGALVRCRKVGAKNWGNKSKK